MTLFSNDRAARLGARRAFVALLACCLLLAPIVAQAKEASDSTDPEPLTLVAGGGQKSEHVLKVEVMRTEAGRERGLMERRYMPADRGMLFDFGVERNVLMWMKNTYLPLDMIFISRHGVVTHIEENAEPMSEAIISSVKPAYAVLEVNAGYCRKIGLKAGDIVRHPAFAP
jgi:uncharacterized membrane protein (UPF0127 family)